MATGIAVGCRYDARCRPGTGDARCRPGTGNRMSRAIWSSFNKERMPHSCDSTVAGPTAWRDNVLANKCEYPPFRYPRFKFARFSHIPRDIPAKILGYPAQKFGFPGFRSKHIPNFLAPTPSHGRPPPIRGYVDPKVWVCAPFSCLTFCWRIHVGDGPRTKYCGRRQETRREEGSNGKLRAI